MGLLVVLQRVVLGQLQRVILLVDSVIQPHTLVLEGHPVLVPQLNLLISLVREQDVLALHLGVGQVF